jgi:hypothetical protein
MVADPFTVSVWPSAIVRVEPVAGWVKATLLILVAVATPRIGVTRVGPVFITKVVPVPVWAATAVAFPVEVIGPVKFAFVVTVEAVVAVVALPDSAPLKVVLAKTPVFELYVRAALDLGGRSPVAAVVKRGKQVVSVPSFVIVMFAGVMAAVPSKLTPPIALAVNRAVAVLALPVSAPTNVVAASEAVAELKVRDALDLGGKSPVAAVVNNGKHVVSVASLAMVMLAGVIAAVPSKFTPPIALGVANAVAVEALPVKAPTKVVVAKLLAEAS